MKLTNDRPFADPDKAARRLMQHAHAFEPVQDGVALLAFHIRYDHPGAANGLVQTVR